MATKHLNNPYSKSIPAIAVALLYLGLYAFPMRRERTRLAAELEQQASQCVVLDQRCQQGLQTLEGQRAAANVQLAALQTDPSDTQLVMLVRTHPTATQTFAHILKLFHTHGLDCHHSLRSESDDLKNQPHASTYRIKVSGGFNDMCRALEDISQNLHEVVPSELKMKRHAVDAPCEWEIVLHFSEGAE